MVDVEITRKTRLTREEAGKRLMSLGKSLADGSRPVVSLDGDSIRFTIADDLEWEFQLEVDGDEVELEIELKWSDTPAAKAPATEAPAVATKPAAADEPAAPDRADPPSAAPAEPKRRTKSSRASSG